MSNSDTPSDVDTGAVQREAQGTGASILEDPEVREAVDLIGLKIGERVGPIKQAFPGQVGDFFEEEVRGAVTRGVSDQLNGLGEPLISPKSLVDELSEEPPGVDYDRMKKKRR